VASRRNQILIASAIWISVCGLGWHAYTNILPKYGLVRRSANARGPAAREEWQKMQKVEQDFYKEPVGSKIQVKVSRAKTAVRVGGWPRDGKEGYHFFATNQKISDIYAALSGTPRWEISQAPDTDERWDVRIKAPSSEKGKVADAFMTYMNWKARTVGTALPGFHYFSGNPPEDPAPQTANPQRGGGNLPQIRLGDARNFIAQRLNKPILVDPDIRDRKPPANIPLPPNMNLAPEKLAAKVANVYGVAVKSEVLDTTSVLVYHPKYTQQSDIQKWLKDGKL
jgi:hypothetical protein